MIINYLFSCHCFASKAYGLGARLFNITPSFGWLAVVLFCCLETTVSKVTQAGLELVAASSLKCRVIGILPWLLKACHHD